MLERSKHGDSCFVTLTYSDEHLPVDGSLEPKVVQLWLKRLRARMSPRALRFFLIGEYGDETLRPHYHVALFGMPLCMRGQTDHRLVVSKGRCCSVCDVLAATWGKGGIDCRELAMETARYLLGYVAKKNLPTRRTRLEGLVPEFARMSLRPGIGAPAMEDVSASLGQPQGLVSGLAGSLPVPRVLMHGRKSWPLGRYLRATLLKGGKFIDDRDAQARQRAEELRVVSARHGTAAAVEALKLGPEIGLVERVERKARLMAKKGSI